MQQFFALGSLEALPHLVELAAHATNRFAQQTDFVIDSSVHICLKVSFGDLVYLLAQPSESADQSADQKQSHRR